MPNDQHQAVTDMEQMNFDAIFDHLPGIVYQFQIDADGEWRFPFVSRNLNAYLGLDAAAVMADASLLVNAIHVDDRAALQTAVAESRQHLTTYTLVHRIAATNGRIKWVHARATPQRQPDGATLWHGLALDITAQKQTEQAYNNLIEHSQQGVLLLQDERVIFANETLARITGYGQSELTIFTIADVISKIHPADREAAQAIIYELVSGKTHTLDRSFRILRPDGAVCYVHAYASRVTHNDRSAIQAILIDITEKHKAASEARRNLERYETALAASLDAFYLLESVRDANGDIINFRFLETNARGARMVGPTREQLAGTLLTDHIPAQHVAQFMPIYAQVADTGRPVEETLQMTLVNNTTRWYQHQIVRVGDGVAVVSRDITKRRQAEEQFRAREEQFRKLFTGMPLPTYAWQRQDDDFVLVEYNSAAINITAGGIKEFIGIKAGEMYHDQPHILADLEACYQQQTVIEREMPYQFKSLNAWRYLNVKYTYISDELIIVVTEDLTEKWRATEQYRAFFGQNVSPVFWLEFNEPIPVDLPASEQVVRMLRDAYFHDVSDTTAHIYGFPNREALVGQPLATIWHAGCQQPDSDEFQALLTFVESGYEIKQEEGWEKTQAGERKWIMNSASGVVENGRLLRVWGSQIDITKRKQAEQAVRRSEARFRTIFNHAPIGIAVVQQDGIIINSNPLFQQMLGYSGAELNNTHVLAHAHKDDIPLEEDKIQQVHAGETDGYTLEKRFRQSDGRFFWATMSTSVLRDETGAVELAVGMVQDITEKRKAEMALRQMKEAIEHSPVSVIITNASGTIEYVNPKFSQVTGYSAAEAVGRSPSMLKSGEHPQEFYADLWQTLISGQEWRGEFYNKRKNGELYWELASIVGIQDENGRITHYVSITEDITQRKQREEEHVRQERLAAVGQLAAGIAHDFNNVMAVITLYSDLLQRSPNLSDAERKKLQVIADQSHHAATLTSQILDFSRRSVRQPRPLDLRILLSEILKFTERTIPEHIQLRFTYKQGSYMVDADPSQMQQIITNLTLNARDAMPRGGEVFYQLDHFFLQDGADPPDSGMAPGRWIKLTVRDTGLGIAPDAIPHIFEPFFTTKEVGRGTGLGLAQVYGIVKQHDGFILVDSPPDDGTTFTVYLPAITPTTVAGDQRTNASHVGRGETILLVEDNETLLEATRLSLEVINYHVLTAVDGSEALAIYRQNPDAVDLILTDVMMPVMDGFNLVDALTDEAQPPPVIMMSGFPRDHNLAPAAQRLVVKWLQKPLDIHKLGELIAAVLQA